MKCCLGAYFPIGDGSKLQGMPDHSAPISIKVGVSHDDVITVAIPRLLPGQPTIHGDIIPADQTFTPIFPHMNDAIWQKARARVALSEIAEYCKRIYEGKSLPVSVNDAFNQLVVEAPSLRDKSYDIKVVGGICSCKRYQLLTDDSMKVYLLAVTAAKNAVITAADRVDGEILFKNAITAALTATNSYIALETTALDLINLPGYQFDDYMQRLLSSGNQITDS